MKKVFALMSIVTMFSMVACGPSNKQTEEEEKARIEDSIRVADSTAAAQQAMEDEMNRLADSAAKADTMTMEAPAEGTEHEGH